MGKEKNVLDEKNAKRGKMIDRIVEKNEVSDILARSDQGDPEGMMIKFNYVHPEDGGFSDVARHEGLMSEVNDIIEEKLEEAKEEGKFINNWDLYQSVGEQVRKDNLEFDDDGAYGLYRNPGKTLQDRIDDERTDAISDMAKSRGQEG